MRRLGAALFVCVFAQLVRPSHADAWWHYFDELSGPGPFNGVEVDVRVICFARSPAASTDRVKETEDSDRRAASRLLSIVSFDCIYSKPHGAESHWGSPRLDEQRWLSFNVDVVYYFAHHHHLEYDDNVRHAVRAFSLRPTVWYRLRRGMDIGAGVGVYRFMGNGFESFNRMSVEPLIDVRPVALIKDLVGHRPASVDRYPDSQLDQILSVRTGLVYMPNGFTDRDFGAQSNRLHTSHEALWTVAVDIDLSPIARQLRRR